eukprot:Sdes_comp9896_c0_seq1m1435
MNAQRLLRKFPAYSHPSTSFCPWLPVCRYASKVSERPILRHDLDGADKGITILTLNRTSALNALGRELVNDFLKALNDLRFDTNVRCVIVNSSSAPKAFCTGADLKERKLMQNHEVKVFLHALGTSFTDLENLPVPTIACVDGYAVGGGLELALCCDMRIVGPHAKVGLIETKRALLPGAGGTQRLPRLIGVARAKELIFTGKVLSGKEAFEYGIANHYCAEAPMEKALEICREILTTGPIAVRMAKQAIDRGIQTDITTGLTVESSYYAQVIPTKDRQEGMDAFIERREPVYKGE